MTIVSRMAYFLNDFVVFLALLSITTFGFALVALKIYKSRLSTGKKKLFLAVSTLAISLISIFVVAEAYFRYVYDVPDGLGFLNVSKKWNERHVVYNNYFYRDRDFQKEKGQGVTRIGAIGDSITFGAGIENVNERFSNLLEKRLEKTGAKVEVYNFGRPGSDLEDEILDFEKVKHLNFDIIVWQYFLNDIQPKTKSTGTRIIETNRDMSAPMKFFTQNSYFFDFLYWRISPKYQKTFDQLRQADLDLYSDPLYLNRHKNLISNFVPSLKENESKVIVVIFPFLNLLGTSYPAANIHTLVTNHFKANNVEVIDLLSDLGTLNKEQLMASKFDPHPNETMHFIVADKLFEYLKPQINKN